MASDLAKVLQEVRGTGAPEAAYTDGIYYDIVEKPTEDDNVTPRLGAGLYGSMKVMAEGADILAPLADDIEALAAITNELIVVGDPANMASVNAIATNMSDVEYFADVYQGPKGVTPTLRNDGSALQAGDLYFDISPIDVNNHVLMSYDGLVWKRAAVGAYTTTESDARYEAIDVDIVRDANYVHTDNNYTTTDMNQVASNTLDINVITEALGNLADAQGSITNGTTGAIGVTETQLDFTTVVASTDPSVFSFDDIANTVTLHKPGSYNFTSGITVESATAAPVAITFNLRNTLNEAIVSTKVINVEVPVGLKEIIPLNTLVVVPDGDAPITIKITASADVVGMTLFAFESILASMSSVSGGFADHSQLTGTSDAGSHPTVAITGLDAALAAKVDDSQVLTNVPAGALFTDTVYTLPATVVHDSESGALHATDALRVLGTSLSLYKGDGTSETVVTQDTLYDDTAVVAAVALNTAKVSNVDHPLVETAVPLGAVFTDTAYPADTLIAQDITNIGNLSGINTGDQDLSGLSLTTHLHPGVYEPVDATIVKTGAANTFTAPQRTSISAEGNAIDFTTSNNFSLAATAANITVASVAGCTGQSGLITITTAENITGWGTEFKFRGDVVPTGLTGTERFAYFVESETSIAIGWVQ